MEKQRDNLFSEKFKLLNSQDHAADINWTSSDSSDFENLPNNSRLSNSNKVGTRKRKRKKKVPKNISNLDIKILDVSRDQNEVVNVNKSPILQKKSLLKSVNKSEKSPILAPSSYELPPSKSIKCEPTSPILTCKIREPQSKARLPDKSPIIPLKYSSPKSSQKVRKKLFRIDDCYIKIKQENFSEEDRNLEEKNNEITVNENSESILQLKQNISLNLSCDVKFNNSSNFASNLPFIIKDSQDEDLIDSKEIKEETEHSIIKQENISTQEEHQINLNDSDSFKFVQKPNMELVNKVKSYFENHFGSQTPSQHSISDSYTPKNSSKNSESYDIVSIATQINSNRNSSQSEHDTSKNPSPVSSQSAETGIIDKSKKLRYKKDGLAYRLNALLKKQTANISLWQHERFLAENSNFLIPKGEHLVFRVQKVYFKYGCYLVEAVDANGCRFLIPINSCYVQDTIINEEAVLKLYEPYKIMDFNEHFRLITNVCKIECSGIDI